jgi:WD40 repeat protein
VQAAPDGLSIPGYEVLSTLGRGGMGVVYKARQTRLGRLVALKMILSGAHAGEADLARFRTEAEAIARLQHPSIVQIFEIGEHEGKPFFSLELCPGGSLEKKLNGTPLPAREAAALVETLARAMHAAHEQHVIHRDLKPANVLLAEDGTPKITDFGLAKKLDEAGQTADGAVMGTPSYMAPEQAGSRPDAQAIGPAADVYALGAILYECLTGRPPFKAATPLDTILQVVADEPVPPTRLQSRTPRDLETICLTCLHKEPARRYASALALGDDLRRFRAGEPIAARPASAVERLVKWARRRPTAAALLAVCLLAAVLLGALAAYFLDRLASERNDAIDARNDAIEARNDAIEARNDAVKAARRESEARKAAEEEWERAEGLLYAGQLKLAQAAWSDNDFTMAMRHLSSTRPNYRDWEYRYLTTQFTSNQLTFRGHNASVLSVCFSRDGKRLATSSEDGVVKVWDVEKRREVLTLPKQRVPVLSVCFSPDDKQLASAGGFMGKLAEVKLWDAATGRLVHTLKGHKAWQSWSVCKAGACALSSTGRALFSLEGNAVWITSVCFSPDGKRLATGSGEYGVNDPVEVKVWDAEKRQVIHTLRGHTGRVTSMSFSPDGKRLTSASWDKTVRVWDAEKGQEIHTLRGHKASRVMDACFSPDGKRLASVGTDRTVKVWDAEKGQEIHTLKGHELWVNCVAYSPDGRHLATGSGDKSVKVWDAEKRQEERILRHSGGVLGVCFSPNGKSLATAGGGVRGNRSFGEVTIWDAQTGLALLALQGHAGPVLSVCFSPDGTRLATASQGGEVKIWNAQTGKDIRTLERHPSTVKSVCFSPDGRRLASACTEVHPGINLLKAGMRKPKPGAVYVWDALTGRKILVLKGHTGMNASVSFSPDGKHLASAGAEGKVGEVHVWDAETGQEVLTLREDKSALSSVCFGHTSRQLATAGSSRASRVWNAETGQVIHTLDGHADWVNSVCFSSDDRRLVTGSQDGTVRLWNSKTGREVLTLKGHTDSVTCVCFSSDGGRLASASTDRTARIWDAVAGKD